MGNEIDLTLRRMAPSRHRLAQAQRTICTNVSVTHKFGGHTFFLVWSEVSQSIGTGGWHRGLVAAARGFLFCSPCEIREHSARGHPPRWPFAAFAGMKQLPASSPWGAISQASPRSVGWARTRLSVEEIVRRTSRDSMSLGRFVVDRTSRSLPRGIGVRP
jgi:hypothetical protein